jgi:hypothetical protein
VKFIIGFFNNDCQNLSPQGSRGDTEENWKQKKTGLVGPAFPRREGCGYIRPDATGASSPAGQPNIGGASENAGARWTPSVRYHAKLSGLHEND